MQGTAGESLVAGPCGSAFLLECDPCLEMAFVELHHTFTPNSSAAWQDNASHVLSTGDRAEKVKSLNASRARERQL